MHRLSISRSDTYTLQIASFGTKTNGAVGTQRRLGTTPIIDGRTQWMSLSATIDNRSNREPPMCTYSIVLLAPRHTGRVRAYTVMDQKWSVAVPARLVTARSRRSFSLWLSHPTHYRPGQAGQPLMAAATDGMGMDWKAGAKSISENELSRIAATYT